MLRPECLLGVAVPQSPFAEGDGSQGGKRQLPLLTRPERMRQVGQVPVPPSTLPAEATCLCHPTLELGTLTTPHLSNLESACSFPIFLDPQLQTSPCLVIFYLSHSTGIPPEVLHPAPRVLDDGTLRPPSV
ncbi:hypothetical protein VTJ04DRAFT_1133 [Mycothermus thermophilus]|uniref:uncharacterized protein n=1 Tax=Humicola insolens TaxID=85995 RepID=UPI0037426A78